LKVALVTSIPRGGPLEHALLLARDLATMGVEVRVVAADRTAAARFDAVRARVAVLPLVRPFDPVGAVRVHRFLRGADVVHTHDRRSGLWVRLAPRGAELRVHTLHGLPEPYLTDTPPGLKARLAYGGVERGLAARTDVLVTPSHAMARLLAERVGYAEADLVVVPNGVDVPAEPLPRGELVGTISLLEPVKGLDVFLTATRLILNVRPQTRFAIFGSGSLEAELRAQAAGLPVEFPGFVASSEALRQLAVFALPSLMENSPLALLEALAAGVPAVASRVGGIPEYAAPGTAMLVPPGDPDSLATAILELLEDPARAGERARAGRAAAAERSAARTAERMVALYEETIRARRP
jgi:glycosyltransferase involved in cell wall biosynthesis